MGNKAGKLHNWGAKPTNGKPPKTSKKDIPKPGPLPPPSNNGSMRDEEEPLGDVEVGRLTPQEFAKMTKNWNKANLVGEGPTGQVYRGTMEGRDVVAKRLTSNSQTEDDFLEEVELVKQFKHKNVVRLLGFCPDAGHRTLAFEFAPLGSLFDLLHGKKDGPPPSVPLTWEQRMKILQGAAQGLEYLHTELGGSEGLVHKRIKSNNVLVFKGYVGKIADCKLQSQDQDSILLDSSLPLGNFACEAPESFTGELSQKSDVYSFGIVLLEALCGRKSMQVLPGTSRQQQSIKEWVFNHIAKSPNNLREIVDPNISADSLSEKALQRFCKLATICLDASPDRRPDMRIVSKSLVAIGRKE